MAGRIRRGTLSVNSSGQSNVSNFTWSSAYSFDRTPADNEYSGIPVEMGRAVSGSFEITAGWVAPSYGTASLVFTENEVSVSAGVETVTQYTYTFDNVTFNTSGSTPASGRGMKTVTFEASTVTRAAVGG